MKQATSIEEQITKLKNRGIIIVDENKAEEILLDIGYYRLGFYSFPFEENYPYKKKRTHKYTDNTNFLSKKKTGIYLHIKKNTLYLSNNISADFGLRKKARCLHSKTENK